jgi:hypothetical protein
MPQVDSGTNCDAMWTAKAVLDQLAIPPLWHAARIDLLHSNYSTHDEEMKIFSSVQ